ncbi:hypothetical protein [Bacillus chungangensis]|uniref:Integral inner membrane protein n=1 Tax=Bacillus chungangensis TaxID=587633 RepID=A0ABT9WNG3_9BACI|nr:hypothetical protein [Bacillus chungangensis]MDQ0174832.1 hypothetical protein [Bacillus chungangensis]
MNNIVYLIIACEIGFWVVIIAGLLCRYVFKKETLSLVFFALTPLIDLILLISASIDLLGGATAAVPHALAAVYIGISLAFGKRMIQWADRYFHYYFLKGPKPKKLIGLAYAKDYFQSWLRHVLAFAIGQGLLWLVIVIIQDMKRTEALYSFSLLWCLILGIDLLISVSYFIWPSKPR